MNTTANVNSKNVDKVIIFDSTDPIIYTDSVNNSDNLLVWYDLAGQSNASITVTEGAYDLDAWISDETQDGLWEENHLKFVNGKRGTLEITMGNSITNNPKPRK